MQRWMLMICGLRCWRWPMTSEWELSTPEFDLLFTALRRERAIAIDHRNQLATQLAENLLDNMFTEHPVWRLPGTPNTQNLASGTE